MRETQRRIYEAIYGRAGTVPPKMACPNLRALWRSQWYKLRQRQTMTTSKSGETAKPEALGRVTFLDGQGELPMLEISTPWSTAEIYLLGAHVTQFRKKDEPPLLFLSQCSRFAEGQPIRGGIPVIFPWFGAREGLGQHGFARVKAWDLKEFAPAPDGSVSVRLRLPDCPEASAFPPFTADYIVTVSQSLTLQLVVTNQSKDAEFTFENCLHTYFDVGDVTAISISGLKGLSYLDKVASFLEKTETSDAHAHRLRGGSHLPERHRHGRNPRPAPRPKDPGGEAGFRVHGGLESLDNQVAADARFRRRGV